jgi:hypothetical protein
MIKTNKATRSLALNIFEPAAVAHKQCLYRTKQSLQEIEHVTKLQGPVQQNQTSGLGTYRK